MALRKAVLPGTDFVCFELNILFFLLLVSVAQGGRYISPVREKLDLVYSARIHIARRELVAPLHRCPLRLFTHGVISAS